MNRWDLREIELVGVPDDLRGYAHGILFDVMGYMKLEKPIVSGEHFSGLLVSQQQRVHHAATIHEIPRPEDPSHSGFLRLVDYDQSADAGFPNQLFATHIAALADERRSAAEREEMFRRALDLFPGDLKQAHLEPSPNANPGNWLSWDGLGNALCDQGKTEEGMECLRRMIEMCPAAALLTRDIVEEGVETGALPPPDLDERTRFWIDLDPEKLKKETDRRLELVGVRA
jgi:hypothetical protein